MQETELLHYIHKTARMGVIGLEDVREHIQNPELADAAAEQIKEYEKIVKASSEMLEGIGENPSDPGLMARISAEIMTDFKTLQDPTDAAIAEMVIQGNTMGTTKTIRHIHDYTGSDPKVQELAQTLLKTEENNVEQMKRFL